MSIPTLDVDREAPTGRYYAYWTEGRRSKRKSMGTRDAGVAQERFAQWLLLRGQQPEGDKPSYINPNPKPVSKEHLINALKEVNEKNERNRKIYKAGKGTSRE